MSDEFRSNQSPPSPPPSVRHLLIIDRRETDLYKHLQAALASDSKTIVVLDRRHADVGVPPGQLERRRPGGGHRHLHFHLLERVRVDIVRHETGRTPRTEDRVNNGEIIVVNDRERVERWVEDSQYVIGRLIPGLLEDRERWRTKAEQAEQESDRLRLEVATMRREIAEREAERQHIGNEQAAIAEAFKSAMEHLTRLQQPLNDVVHRLNVMQPGVAEVSGA